MGAPSHVLALWSRWMLRQLSQSARYQALPSHQASHHAVHRTRGKLALVLLGRDGSVTMDVTKDSVNSPELSKSFPTLTPAQIERMKRFGEVRTVAAGEILFEQGDVDVPFFVLLSCGME